MSTERNYFALQQTDSGENVRKSPRQIEEVDYEIADSPLISNNVGNDESVYNHTFDTIELTRDGDNVYDKTGTFKEPGLDDTYNHTIERGGQVTETENIYNKTNIGDVYDHTGRNRLHRIETDNVYNTTTSADIYNRIGEAVDGGVRSENVYAKTES